MKYFTNVNSLDELKKEYRRLTKLHHPDCGGDTTTMQAINAEHDELFEVLKLKQNAQAEADTTGRTKKTTETAAEFREIVTLLLKLDGITVELCGSWLWISGETKKHKEQLKAARCRWSSSKKMWYWHHPEEGCRWSRGKSDMGSIRRKYGSQRFSRDGKEDLAAART